MATSALIVGCGSIGLRHAKNLRALGAENLLVFDTDPERASMAASESGATVVTSLDDALRRRPDAALICTPPHLHLAAATAAVEAGVHVFIEKPLADKLSGLESLMAAAESRRLVIMAGYNLRFHAALKKVKEAVDSGAIGRVLTVRAEYGQYLPTWRPGRDYRKGYITRPETGGGIILEESHELDYVAWLGGRVSSVYAAAGKLSDLDMTTEDTALIVLRLVGGALGEIHVDCVQREYSRSCKVVGTNGTVTWTHGTGVRLVVAERQADSWPINPDPNQMYLDEMRCFMDAIGGRQVPPVDGWGAMQNLKVALAAKSSAALRREVAVE